MRKSHVYLLVVLIGAISHLFLEFDSEQYLNNITMLSIVWGFYYLIGINEVKK